MLTYNRCRFNFLACKAVYDNIIYRYKYVISCLTVDIKLSYTKVVVTRIPNERSQLNTKECLLRVCHILKDVSDEVYYVTLLKQYKSKLILNT